MPLTAPEPRRRRSVKTIDYPSPADIVSRLECNKGGCSCHASVRRGHGVTHCPSHNDEHTSLSVNEKAGWTVWNCHGGCSNLEVRAALQARGIWPQ